MTVLLRDKPPTYDWGWFSREDQRMHLQTVDKEHRKLHYKLWLEAKGKRVLEPEPGIPAKVLKSLKSALEHENERERIEIYWVIFMMENGWLQLRVTGPRVTLIAYPNSPNRFTRTIDLHDYIGDPETVAAVTPDDVALNKELGMLEIFCKREEARRHHIDLLPILWI